MDRSALGRGGEASRLAASLSEMCGPSSGDTSMPAAAAAAAVASSSSRLEADEGEAAAAAAATPGGRRRARSGVRDAAGCMFAGGTTGENSARSRPATPVALAAPAAAGSAAGVAAAGVIRIAA